MEAFDKYATNYAAIVQKSVDFSGLGYDFFIEAKAYKLKEIAARYFGQFAKPNLLDVGCGVGRLHSLLADKFGQISGVDMSVQCIEQARKDNPNVDYKINTGSELPYSAGTFDLVTTVCVVHHVAPLMWPTFIAELKRITRPGGLICLIEHNPLHPLTRLAVLRCPFDRDATLLSAGRARQLLTQAGLTNVRSEHFLFFPKSAPWIRALEHWLGALPIGAQYVAVGEC